MVDRGMAINIHERPERRLRYGTGAGGGSPFIVTSTCSRRALLSIINEGLVTMTVILSRGQAGLTRLARRWIRKAQVATRETVAALALIFFYAVGLGFAV